MAQFSFRILAVLLLVLATVAGALGAQAADSRILYDDFRAADGGFQSNYGLFVSVGGPVGAQFTTPFGGPFLLDRIDLALSANGSSAGLAHVRMTLRANTTNEEPGTILEMIERDDIARNPPTYASGTYAFVSQLHPVVESASAYWVVIENAGDNSLKPFWNLNLVGAHDAVVEYQDPSWVHYNSSFATNTFRVVAEPVPEPGTLLLSALAGVMALSRSRRAPVCG